MYFSLAIDDNLAEELCRFKTNQQCDVDIVEKTLHYYKGYSLFTKKHLTKYYTDKTIQNNVLQSTAHIDLDSLESIRKNTIYKIILSSQRDVNFPYVSIYDDRIENNFTATFFKDEPREKALEHLKSLLENANYVFIYDKFITQNWASFKLFCESVLPQKRLTIHYPPEQNRHFKSNEIKALCNHWKCSVADNRYSNYSYGDTHDRYLIIDNKIEIILTSGIDNLMDKSKDFTYIVRQHK